MVTVTRTGCGHGADAELLAQHQIFTEGGSRPPPPGRVTSGDGAGQPELMLLSSLPSWEAARLGQGRHGRGLVRSEASPGCMQQGCL